VPIVHFSFHSPKYKQKQYFASNHPCASTWLISSTYNAAIIPISPTKAPAPKSTGDAAAFRDDVVVLGDVPWDVGFRVVTVTFPPVPVAPASVLCVVVPFLPVVATAVLDVVIVAFGAVVMAMLAVARYDWHRAAPTLAAWSRSAASVHALTRQGAARLPMALWVGPHWQPMSVGAHPAAVMAETRQEVAHAGSPSRFWAITAPAATRIRAVLILVC